MSKNKPQPRKMSLGAQVPRGNLTQPQPPARLTAEDVREALYQLADSSEVNDFGKWVSLESFKDELNAILDGKGEEQQPTMIESEHCLGCGQRLLMHNAWMNDGCPCNSDSGVNDLNRTRWQLLWDLQQQQARELEAALKQQPQPLEPVKGPPNLDGVPDDALFVVYKFTHAEFCGVESAQVLRNKWVPEAFESIKWHLGPITPSAEEADVPRCPWCGCDMEFAKDVGDHTFWLVCGDEQCLAESPVRESEKAAIEAAMRFNDGEY